MRRLTAIGLMSMMFLALGSPLAAQQYPPEVLGEVAVSDSTIVCPGDVTVTGTAWAPGEEVRILFDGSQIATVVPNAQGSFSVTVTTPSASLGPHTLTAVQESAADGTVSAQSSITCVGAEGVAAVGDGLADTGAAIAMWMAIAFGLLLAGGAILFVGRRRRTNAAR